MDVKIKIYSAMPPPAKRVLTASYIRMRKVREWIAKELQPLPPQGQAPRIVYVTGFPRSGTTLLKYFYGSHPGLRQTTFNPAGFHHAWRLAQAYEGDEILIDKSNHYIYALETMFEALGDAIRICVIVRDPRDCIASLIHYGENREVPRSPAFWAYWGKQHAKLIDLACHHPLRDQLHLVRYEDLVRFPTEAKAAFLRWLDFDVTPHQLDRSYEVQHPGEGWHDSVFEQREVSAGALQKWQSVSDPPGWAAELIPAWQDDPGIAATMASLGYTAEGFGAPDLENLENLFRPASA